MSITIWLLSLRTGSKGAGVGRGHDRKPSKRHALRSRSCLPWLEALEDRSLPSTLTVTTTFESGAGSLRAAVGAASNNDTIVFESSLKGKTITLTSGELAITKSLDIEGLGAANLTVSGNDASRV